MKKTVLFMFLITILVLSSISAFSELYSGYVDSGAVIPIEERSFSMLVSTDQSFVKIQDGADSIEVRQGKCRVFEHIEICYNFSDWDSSKMTQRAYLDVYKKPLVVRINRTVDLEDLYVGNKREVNTVLRTEKAVEGISFLDQYPDDVIVKCSSKCSVKNNAATWNGDMQNDDSVFLRYYLTFKGSVDRNLRASAKYFDGFDNYTQYSDELTFKAFHYLNVTPVYDDDDLELGDEFEFKIFIENKNSDEKMAVSNFYIYMPKGLSVLLFSDSLKKINNSVYSWSGNLDPDRIKNFTFKLKGVLPGFSNIYVKANYRIDDKAITYAKKRIGIISILNKNFDIYSNLKEYITEYGFLEARQQIPFKLYVENLANVSVYDVQINVTGFPGVIIDKFDPLATRKAMDFDYTVDDVSKQTSITKSITITYHDIIGTEYTQGFTETYPVMPIQSFDLKYDISKDKIYSGDDFVVSLTMTSKRTIYLKSVKVEDFPPFKADGITSANANFKEGSEIKMYSYRLKAPIVNETKDFSIETKIYYTIDNSTFTQDNVYNITVYDDTSRPGFNIKVDKKVPSNTLYFGELVPVSYTIENNENKTAWNALLKFGMGEGFDLVETDQYFMSKIDPLDEVNIQNVEFLRLKTTGTITVPPSVLSYYDSNKNNFSIKSSKLTLTAADGYIEGPAIVATKQISSDKIEPGKEINVTVEIKNIGDKDATVTFNDRGDIYDKTIVAGTLVNFTYKMTSKDIGKHEIEPLRFNYSYMQYVYLGVSSTPEFEVINNTPKKTKINKPKINIVENDSILNITEPEPNEFSFFYKDNWIFYSLFFMIGVVVFVLTIYFFKNNEKKKEKVFTFGKTDQLEKIYERLKK